METGIKQAKSNFKMSKGVRKNTQWTKDKGTAAGKSRCLDILSPEHISTKKDERAIPSSNEKLGHILPRNSGC